MCLRCLTFACYLLIVPALTSAQSTIQYSFKTGEHLRYHYKLDGSYNAMGTRGGRKGETVFEADPDWNITGVTMNNEVYARLTVLNRSERYIEGNWKLSSLHFTPQTDIVFDAKGKLLYTNILIDDTERTFTKQMMNQIPGIHLLLDKEAFEPYFERLLYSVDTAHVDTLGKPSTEVFDSIVSQPLEHDTIVPGYIWRFLTAWLNPYHYSGTTTYSLKDTIVSGNHFWLLHSVTKYKSQSIRWPDLGKSESVYVGDILFRKQDNVIESWHCTVENHTPQATFNSEVWLTLTSLTDD